MPDPSYWPLVQTLGFFPPGDRLMRLNRCLIGSGMPYHATHVQRGSPRAPPAWAIRFVGRSVPVDSSGPFVTGVTAQKVLTTSFRPRSSVLARVRVRLLGGAPNAAIAAFVAALPAAEAQDADTMLVLLHPLPNRTVSAARTAPLLQKDRTEVPATLDRLAGEPTRLIERTRHDARPAEPRFRRASHALAAPGTSATYRRGSTEESDRKVIGLVRETGEINARMVRLLLDLDTPATSTDL